MLPPSFGGVVDIVISRFFACAALVGLLASCTSDWDSSRKGKTIAASDRGSLSGTPRTDTSQAPALRSPTDGFASLPDRGELVAYDSNRKPRVNGAYSAYPIKLSEEHALKAAYAGGQMLIRAPNGEAIKLTYERHVEHPDGNWSWIGRDANGADAIITFGEKAAFGTIPQQGEESLRLTIGGGQAWLVATDRSKMADPDHAAMRAGKTDYLIPPQVASNAVLDAPTTSASAQAQSAIAPAAGPTVDVVVGYTTGFAAERGGNSQAVTRINNLVDITNQAYTNSAVNATLRLVATVSVDYVDNDNNGTALEQLSGYKSGSGPIPPNAAFAALRAARDTYGGDLVSLVRDFRTPENGGCGIAWLIGAGQSGIEQADEPFGYSVVSDGSDFDEVDNVNYNCREETFAHELGHNMGQAHNSQDSNSSGAHAYSYGYREAASDGFYTVMAYRLAGSSQFGIRHFANPGINYGGRPTGVANAADNTRSLNQTIPIIAGFRASVIADPGIYTGPLLGMGGKCLDARGRGTALGTAIQIYDCNGESQQQWQWALQKGFGVIRGVGSARVLDVGNYAVYDGAQLQLWDSTGATNQSWLITQFSIIAAGGRVLDAAMMSSANGTKIQLWDSTRTPHQTWNFDPARGYITGKDGKCLDVEGFGTANGTRVQLWTCSDTPNQKWSAGPNGTILGYGGKCLEAANGSTANGTVVRMWDCNGGAHQSWKVRGQIVGQMSGKCLDDPSAGQTNGMRVHIWQCHPGENQQWTFAWH